MDKDTREELQRLEEELLEQECEEITEEELLEDIKKTLAETAVPASIRCSESFSNSPAFAINARKARSAPSLAASFAV